MILLCLKGFFYIEKLIEWQNSRKAYKKQTLGFLQQSTNIFDYSNQTEFI